MRALRNACGANFMNQSLYISTDFAMSVFHCCGLSRFIGIFARVTRLCCSYTGPHFRKEFTQGNVAAGRLDLHLVGQCRRETDADDSAGLRAAVTGFRFFSHRAKIWTISRGTPAPYLSLFVRLYKELTRAPTERRPRLFCRHSGKQKYYLRSATRR